MPKVLHYIRVAISATLLLVNIFHSFPQSPYIFEKGWELEEVPLLNSSVHFMLHTHAENEVAYYSQFSKKGKELTVWSLDLNTSKKMTEVFKLNSAIPTINGVHPSSLVIYRDTLVFTSDRTMYFLDRKTKKEVNRTSLSSSREYLYQEDGFLYTANYYNYHPKQEIQPVIITKFSSNGRLLDSISFTVPFAEYTHYAPKKFMSFKNGTFILPLFDGFRLLKIDKNLKQIDTIDLTLEIDSNWVIPSIELHHSIMKNRDTLNWYWNLLDQENTKRIHRIDYVEFIGKDEILVRWFKYDSLIYMQRYFISIIKLEPTPIVIKTFDEKPSPFDISIPFSEGGLPIYSFTGRAIFVKNGLYVFSIDIPYFGNPDITYSEYYAEKKEKEKKMEPVLILKKFKLKE